MRSWKILAIAWFSLQAAAVPFHGRVVDDRTDSPVYSALLRVIRPSPREVIADLETDRAGRFSADEIPAGEYRLEISKANFQPTIMDIQWSASTQQDFHIRLVHLGTIAGKILDSQGQPVRNAIVVTFDMGERPARPVGSYVQVDAKGEYRAFGLRPGRYAVGVSYADARPGVGSGMTLFPNNASPQTFAITGGEEYQADFSIFSSSLYRIKGAVETKSSGRFGVTLISTGLRSVALAQKQTTEGAKFEFEGIPPGSYDILVAGPTIGYGSRKVMLGTEPMFGRLHVEVGADMDNLLVTPTDGKSASFMLKSSGSERPEGCPATATLTLSPTEDWGVLNKHDVSVGFAKAAVAAGLAPGQYRINATGLPAECSVPPKVVELGVKENAPPVEVPVESAGSIRGRLVEESHTEEVSILLVPLDPDGSDAAQNQMINPDGNSHFVIGNLRPGRYRLMARSTGTSEAIEVEVRSGKPVDVDLHISAKSPLKGREPK